MPLDKARHFLASSDSERLKMVELADNPREFLSLIPATELWLTIRRLTPEDSLLLIKSASPDQLQVVFDIEWWRRDRLEMAPIIEWLGYISACGMKKIVEWFRECDWDQILWFFKENIVVFKNEDSNIDPSDAVSWPREETPITHEGVYYFQVLDKKHDTLIRHLLEVLAKNDIELYHTILEDCIWDIPSQREEEAYDARGRRLAEHGFPTFDEALSLYSPLSASCFKIVKKKHVEPKGSLAPRYPLTVLGDQVLFINRVLADMDGEGESEALREIANIANKVETADGHEIDPEALGKSIIKGVGYINIGLEILSGGDIGKAASLLSEYWLENIFQVGLNEVVKASGNAKKIFNDSWMVGNEGSLLLLEDEYRLLIENILKKRPLFFSGGDQFSEKGPRDFLSMEEIDLAKARLKEAEFFGTFIERVTGKSMKFLAGIVDRIDELRFSGMIITMVIKGALRGEYGLGPVSLGELDGFLKKGDVEERAQEAFDRFRDRVFKRLNDLSGEEVRASQKLTDIARDRFLDDFKNVSKIDDKRYVQSLWLK